MPQPYPAAPQHRSTTPARVPSSRSARRALALAVAGLALCAPGAVAQQEAGAPTAQPAPAKTRTAPAASTALSRAVIRRVQRKLHLKPDGVLGPRTRSALRRYQKRHGLRVTGRLFPETLTALKVQGRAAAATPAPSGPIPAGTMRILTAIADCESGGDPTAVSKNGQHRGKYQFLRSTWEAMGGAGDPAAAPEAEQDQRAAALYAKQGAKPWPVCGPKAEESAGA